MWQAAPFTPISATDTTRVQLAHPRLSLYTGMTPPTSRRMAGLARGVCAQARARPPVPPHAPCLSREPGPSERTRFHPSAAPLWLRPHRAATTLWSTPAAPKTPALTPTQPPTRCRSPLSQGPAMPPLTSHTPTLLRSTVGNQHKWDRLGPEKIIIMKSCVGAP